MPLRSPLFSPVHSPANPSSRLRSVSKAWFALGLCAWQLAVAAAGSELPRARWLDNGLIDAGGNHEPYTFQVRRGGQRVDARQQCDFAQSEQLLRRLKAQGVEVFHTHLYKGFGQETEKTEMEETRRAAELAHRLGLKVDTYVQWNTLMYETFFAEEPRAKNWVQRDANGRPILLSYGYQQSFRYRPCFANPEYLDYLKRVVRYAVKEVKTDFLHFDNFDLNPEPDSCHCRACVEGFRKYLKGKYTPLQRRERFGFENLDFVNPPEWNRFNPPEKMRIISDPVVQEWIDYRCQMMADALRQIALYAKALNPEVVIETNPHGITGGNRPWESGIDHSRVLKWTEAFWTENDPQPGYTADGRLLSRIRTFKLARAYRNVVLTYIAEDPVAMAESLAFNQTLGFVGITSLPAGAVAYGRNQSTSSAGVDSLPPDMLRYIGFYRKHRDLFVQTKEVPAVAVLRSYASLCYNHAQTELGAVLAEQALIQAHIPFNLVFDEHLADLSPYKVLILPESECLADDQLAAIRRYVAKGGGLVAIGRSGLYDQWRRLRAEPGLKELLAAQSSVREPGEPALAKLSGQATRGDYERGRTAYLPALVYDGPLPAFADYFPVDQRFWKKPANAPEFIDAVRWTARNDLPVEVEAPEFLVSNLVAQPEQRRWLLHLVNYGAKRIPAVQTLRVTCRGVPGNAVTVSIFSPEADGPTSVPATRTDSGLTFTVPEVKTYAIAVVQW